MLFVYLVRGDDDAFGEPFFALVQACQQLLVGRPCAPRHQDGAVVALQEALHHGVGLGGLGYLVYAVVSGVAGKGTMVDAVAFQQLPALFVLHEEMLEAKTDLAQEPSAVPFEEVLLRTEDGREDIGVYAALAQGVHVVVPELVLDEKDLVGMDCVEEAAHVARGVHGQVADGLGLCVVLTHLVARRGEEGDEYLAFGMPLAVGFQHGPCLLELAEAGGVEPHRGLSFLKFGQCRGHLLPACHHLARLGMTEQGCRSDAQGVKVDCYGVYEKHLFSYELRIKS